MPHAIPILESKPVAYGLSTRVSINCRVLSADMKLLHTIDKLNNPRKQEDFSLWHFAISENTAGDK